MKRALAASLLLSAACASPSPDDRTTGELTSASTAPVKEVDAIDRARYPDNLAYLYEGPLAKILWVQNVPAFQRIDKMESYLRDVVARGVAGEVISSSLPTVQPLPANPQLQHLARSSFQAAHLMAQHAKLAHDYTQSLQATVGQYNSDAQKLAEIAANATRVNTQLLSMGQIAPVAPIPPAAPNSDPALRTGTHLSGTVLLGKQRYLTSADAALQRAIFARDTAAYGEAFSSVFAAQMDPQIRDEARVALGRSHQEALLSGHPLDGVIRDHVLPGSDPTASLAVEQLRLLNQVNLLSHHPTAPREAQILALLLVGEDLRQGQVDAAFSCFKIWNHIQDTNWLVTEYLRLKGSGNAQQVLDLVADIIAGMGSL